MNDGAQSASAKAEKSDEEENNVWKSITAEELNVNKLQHGIAVEMKNDDGQAEWHFADWKAFVPPIRPWLHRPAGEPLRLVICIEAVMPGRQHRQYLAPAQLLRYLRLLDLHPVNHGGDREELRQWAWMPIQVLAWQPRGDVAARFPELGFLLAASVSWHLPISRITSTVPPQPASQREVRRYFFRDLGSNLAHHHALGNKLAPVIIGTQLVHGNDLLDTAALSGLDIASVEGVAFQASGSLNVNDHGELDRLWEVVQDRHRKWNDMNPLIFDDDAEAGKPWRIIWDKLFGEGQWMNGWNDRLKDDFKCDTLNGDVRAGLLCKFNVASIAIIDLRLRSSDHNNIYNMEDLTGIKLIKQINQLGIDTPLLVLTSSNRLECERLALANGAYVFMHKPARFDEADDAADIMGTLARFLHPAFYWIRITLKLLNEKTYEHDELTSLWHGYKNAVINELKLFQRRLGKGLKQGGDPIYITEIPLPYNHACRDLGDICRTLDVAGEAAFGLMRCAAFRHGTRAIGHFRNMTSHGGAGLLQSVVPKSMAPGWLGFAMLAVASRIALGCAATDSRWSYTSRELFETRMRLTGRPEAADNAMAGRYACRQIETILSVKKITDDTEKAAINLALSALNVYRNNCIPLAKEWYADFKRKTGRP